MINYIICDDKVLFRQEVEKIIDCVMMRNDMPYEKYSFENYDASFMKLVNQKKALKIYILDIEVNGKSGIDIAKEIRKNDIESMLIFCTAYYEKYKKDMLKSRFLFLDFIDKSGNYQKELEDTIALALKNLSMKNIIRFKNQNIVHTIATKDILYIVRDKDRKCTIQTTDNQIIVNKTLIELKNMLDNRFVYAHRACIVNYDRISQFDKKNKTILFDNNMGTDLVSSRFKMDDA